MSVRISLIVVIAVLAAICIGQGQATTCYGCDGQACLRTSQVNVARQCPTNDPCIAMFKGFVPIEKGCYSDLTAAQKVVCDAAADVSCYTCTGDHCNSLGRVDHRCKDCTATSSNSSCLYAPELVMDKQCVAPRTQDVYCSVKISGSSTIRGCVTSNRDILDCLASPATCSLCPVSVAHACNRDTFPANRRQCQYCTGDLCENVNATVSSAAVLRTCPDIADQCVSINHNGVYKRSCAAEADVTALEHCTKHPSSCVYCSSNGCNVATAPSGAASASAMSVLTLVSAVAVAMVWSSTSS